MIFEGRKWSENFTVLQPSSDLIKTVHPTTHGRFEQPGELNQLVIRENPIL